MERGTTSWHATARVLTPSVVRKASGKACTLTDLLFDPHRPSTQNRDSLLLFVALPSIPPFYSSCFLLSPGRALFSLSSASGCFLAATIRPLCVCVPLEIARAANKRVSRVSYIRLVRTRGVHAGHQRRRRMVVTRRVWLYNVINAHTTRSERSRLLLPPFYRVPRH